MANPSFFIQLGSVWAELESTSVETDVAENLDHPPAKHRVVIGRSQGNASHKTANIFLDADAFLDRSIVDP